MKGGRGERGGREVKGREVKSEGDEGEVKGGREVKEGGRIYDDIYIMVIYDMASRLGVFPCAP